MFNIFQYDTIMIQESKLRQRKRDAMLFLIQTVLSGIPFKIGAFFHKILRRAGAFVNIFIWPIIWAIIHNAPASPACFSAG
jgi:hypothetical protein